MELNGIDDMHHHLRDGKALETTVPFAAKQFERCIAMPNLKPPVTTTALALEYYDRIMQHVPANSKFKPLMTLYMTDGTTREEILAAHASKKVFAVKYYPAGATTNSASGVTNIENTYGALEAMAEVGMPLLVHGEVTDTSVDIFDREAVFINTILQPLIRLYPALKVVMEHITTSNAVEFVKSAGENVAATITPQHLLYNRNAIFESGLRPHKYCLPVLKRETHRQALIDAIRSGSTKFFLGTDSAPHLSSKKESSVGCAGIFTGHAAIELYAKAFEAAGCLENLPAFASTNGASFYNLPMNENKRTLKKTPWTVPTCLPFENGTLVPLCSGETLDWHLQ